MNLFVPALRSLALACGLLVFSLAPCRAQSIDRIVPRHPDAIELPELGRVSRIAGLDCGFGDAIYPIGDCNGDTLTDWIVARRRCDTTISGRTPTDLLLYKGVRGSLPATEDRLRIGPDEIGSGVTLHGAGDFDDDGYRDLLISIELFAETDALAYHPTHLTVWWGNEQGIYTLNDTSRLENGLQRWLGPTRVLISDFNRDGADDVFLLDWAGFADGESIELTGLPLFLGAPGKRWGRDRKRREDWIWWNPPRISRFIALARRLQLIDQDKDNLLDLVLYEDANNNSDPSWIKIIYGKEGEIIDTGNIVEVDLAPASGKKALLADISGDRVPELLVNTGGEETLKAYVGFRGQRIVEQFGSGDEPSHPGEEVWWGKPWAAIPLPAKLHDGWAASGWSLLFDFGDAGLDGVGDVWVVSVPDYICYNGGHRFDSLYDAWIRSPGSGGQAMLGDIDGSGKQTIAFGSSGTIKFVQPSERVPTGGKFRQLPPGTDTPVSGVPSGQWGGERSLDVQAVPNPASGEVRIIWSNGSVQGKSATVRITDALGQEVLTTHVPAEAAEFIWDASQTFGGTYFITVTLGDLSLTLPVTIQR